jgi:hypothetical protein
VDLHKGEKINPEAGCIGREEKERKREGFAAKCVDRTISFHIIYQETQFCGCIPKERVNHVYLIVFMVDAMLFFIWDTIIA